MFEAIQTIAQNCRRCYSCVRDCPVKAIKIVEGQASVVAERCIACGNCTMVCSQHAKTYALGLQNVEEFLGSGRPVLALLAPSFPAEFPDHDPGRLVGALKEAGFTWVVEVAYGADLVSEEYRDFLAANRTGLWIASTCPAVNEYVCKYQPELTSRLIPVVSPMIATAIAARKMYPENAYCVFIGPCIAKKLEARQPDCPPVVDEVLTFKEIKTLFAQKSILLSHVDSSAFDPPHAGIGRAFPLSGGLLKSARLEHDVLDQNIIVVNGPHEITEIFGTAARGEIKPQLIEALMCHGCHSGPGMTERNNRHQRREVICKYVKDHLNDRRAAYPPDSWPVKAPGHHDLALKRTFMSQDHRLKDPTEQEIQAILARTNKFTHGDELNCRACGYETCRSKAVAVHHGLAEDAMCLPFMIDQAERVCLELKIPWQEIRQVHRHLINTEKLASMGQLAAGVAHELNNPLGTILLYTSLLHRKLKERPDLSHDLNLLTEEANRCKKIVGGLLDFARQNKVRMEPVNISEMILHIIDNYYTTPRLAEKGIRVTYEAKTIDPVADLDADQITQVMINLVNNALSAMDSRPGEIKISLEGPTATGGMHILVADQGCGIPAEDRERIFQPFFTTKSIGKGVGLGLPICYGIVKMHRGNIWFDSVIGSGTTFHIELPKNQALAGRSVLK